MLIHPKFIYVHLPKAAGTYVESCLSTIYPESKNIEGMHGALHEKGKHSSIHEIMHEVPGKVVFGTIRNPFNWYVSRFRHGKRTKRNLAFQDYDFLNHDFKSFIMHMTDSEYQRQHLNVKWVRWSSRLNDFEYLPVFEYMRRLDIGLYTFEYIYAFFDDYNLVFKGNLDVFQNHDTLISIQHCIRQENLPEGLIEFLRHTNLITDKSQEETIRGYPAMNVLGSPNPRDVFNSEMIELVKYKDRLIFITTIKVHHYHQECGLKYPFFLDYNDMDCIIWRRLHPV